jgi:hypothetical protein
MTMRGGPVIHAGGMPDPIHLVVRSLRTARGQVIIGGQERRGHRSEAGHGMHGLAALHSVDGVIERAPRLPAVHRPER